VRAAIIATTIVTAATIITAASAVPAVTAVADVIHLVPAMVENVPDRVPENGQNRDQPDRDQRHDQGVLDHALAILIPEKPPEYRRHFTHLSA
jgi:hypothetical protein